MEFVYAKKLIQSAKGGESWFGASYNTNIYRGCNHGCIYCDSRSACYQIDHFDTIRAKQDAPVKIEEELKNKRKKGIISFGGMNDPYNIFEKELQYTRKAMISANKHQFGVFIITKSNLVVRDIDIFKQISEFNVCNVGITITTSDDRLGKRIERNCSSSSERFEAIRKLRDAGIFSGILMMPILPFINDTKENIEGIVKKAHEVGANYIYPSFGVTLRDRQRNHFYGKIGVKLSEQYNETFGDSYMCASPKVKELKSYFIELCEKYGIMYRMKDIVHASQKTIKTEQLVLDI